SDAHQKLFGRSLGFSRVKVPFSTSRLVSLPHSSSAQSHQTTSSGFVSSATSWTHAASAGRLVPAWSSIRLAPDIANSLPQGVHAQQAITPAAKTPPQETA